MLSCRRCRALVKCRSRVVPGDGVIPAQVVFVGIAPGRFGGDRTGIPFSGDRSGNLLREMLGVSGLEQVFITNLVRCSPRDRRGRNCDPSAREVVNCASFLRAELAQAAAPVIVCLGRMVWRTLTGEQRSFHPADPKPIARDGVLLYPMYHPAYVNRGAYVIGDYARDFARLREVLLERQRLRRLDERQRWFRIEPCE